MARSEDEAGTESGFEPLSMIDMWQDLHQLIDHWSTKYKTTPDLAATALREFAETLSNQPPKVETTDQLNSQYADKNKEQP